MKRKEQMGLAIGLLLFAQGAQADWTLAKRFTFNSSASGNPAMAVDSSGNIHVVWEESGSFPERISYKKSTDGGTTWTANKTLQSGNPESDLGWVGSPKIAVDLFGNLHAVWAENPYGHAWVGYSKSTDGGATWTTGASISGVAFCSGPDIAADSSGNLHLVWFGDPEGWINSIVFYQKSMDGGNTWTPRKGLTLTSPRSEYPAITVDLSDNLHVVWVDGTSANLEIYYDKSTDGGETWTPAKKLTDNLGLSMRPDIATDLSSNPHMVWSDNTPGNYEIYYEKSVDGGSAWITAKRISWIPGWSGAPTIAADFSGSLHVVWPDNSPGNSEIYFRKSTDGGATWTYARRITWTPGASYVPVIAADPSGNLHLVWDDNTPGNYEIYYKKFIQE